MGVVAEDKRNSIFAGELQIALERSRMTVQDVVHQLHNHGYTLSVKTFSQWCQGYFLPRHINALQLVETLEKICGVRSGHLCDALLEDFASGKSFVPEQYKKAQEALVPKKVGDDKIEEYLETVDSQIDWKQEIIREIIHDEVVVNPQRDHLRHRTTIFGRVPDTPVAFLNVSAGYEEGDEMPDLKQIVYDVEGGEVVEQTVNEEDGFIDVATRIKLPDDTVPGALHQVSYTYDSLAPDIFTHAADRFFAFPLAFYSCSVTFEKEVPEKIEYVFSASDEDAEKNEIVTSLTPIENTVRMSRGNVFNGTGCVRWENE